MIADKNKIQTKVISLIIVQVSLITSLVYPEPSFKNIYRLNIAHTFKNSIASLRAPMGSGTERARRFLDDMHGVVSHATAQARRKTQEDRYIVPRISIEEIQHGNGQLMAVMDGHNGDEVAEIIAEQLPEVFKDALIKSQGDVLSALRSTFKILHERTKDEKAGTTVSVVYIPDDELRAYVGVLGDSPVIILDRDKNVIRSPQHNIILNREEREAAIRRGAKYDPRGYIFGSLDPYLGTQLSRTLGDCALDDILGREPDIYSVPLCQESFIIVGSDGLFVLEDTNAEIQQLVALLHDGKDAQALVSRAERIRQDNITAVVWRKVLVAGESQSSQAEPRIQQDKPQIRDLGHIIKEAVAKILGEQGKIDRDALVRVLQDRGFSIDLAPGGKEWRIYTSDLSNSYYVVSPLGEIRFIMTQHLRARISGSSKKGRQAL